MVEWIGVMAVIVAIIGAVIVLGAPVRRQVTATFNAQACRVTNDCVGGGLGGVVSLERLVGAAGGAAAAHAVDRGLAEALSDTADGVLNGTSDVSSAF